MSLVELLWLLLQDAFWSGLASLGFAVLFNVPPRLLPGCALCGAAGHMVRTLLMETTGFTIEGATLVGATTVGFLGTLLARYLRSPVPIFTVTGVIPMVPGSFAFGTMINLLQFTAGGPNANTIELVDAAFNASKTALILGAIAVGIAAPSLLFQRRK